MRLGTINITNKVNTAEIDIEGIIGVPEWWQFDDPAGKVATWDKFKTTLNDIQKLSAPEIIVNIRSLGGDTNAALMIHDALAMTGATIVTRCFGYVASAATLIAQAASAGRREVSANSLYLIHQSSLYFFGGNINDLQAAEDMLAKTDERISNLYATRSGKDVQSFVSLMAEDGGNGKWLSPDEVLEFGLADTVVKMSGAVNLSMSDFKALGLPSVPKDRIITNKSDNMKVNKAWTAILNFFKFDAGAENEIDEAQLGRLNEELTVKNQSVVDLTAQVEQAAQEKATLVENHAAALAGKDAEIATLTNKVSDLEGQLAQAKAGATQTEPREDPTPSGDPKKKENAAAYDEDIKNFKKE